MQVGEPMKISTYDGSLSAEKFHWVSLFAGGKFPKLRGDSHYWIAVLPGSTYDLTKFNAGVVGIQLGGVADHKDRSPRIRTGGHSELFTSATLASTDFNAPNSHYGCRKSAAIEVLLEKNDWTSSYDPRFATTADLDYDGDDTPRKRYGAILCGNPVKE